MMSVLKWPSAKTTARFIPPMLLLRRERLPEDRSGSMSSNWMAGPGDSGEGKRPACVYGRATKCT